MASLSFHGLRNQGATCYLNSVLQVLFMTPEVHQALEQPSNDTDHILKALFDELKQRECGTESITEHLHIHDAYRQRDAAVYLELLLMKLSSKVSEAFSGQYSDITQCGMCGHQVEVSSPFWTLPVALSNSSSARQSFEKMFGWTSLSGVYCDKCGEKNEAQSTCHLTTPPQILVLLLRRFDIRGGAYCKSECEVELEETLHIQDISFSLCGVVDHWGSVSGGHYTATLQCQGDGSWFCFNDGTVEKTGAPSGLKSSTAYLLVYRSSAHPSAGQSGTPPPEASPEQKQDKGLLESVFQCFCWFEKNPKGDVSRSQKAADPLISVVRVLSMIPEFHKALKRKTPQLNSTEQGLKRIFDEKSMFDMREALQIQEEQGQLSAAKSMELLMTRLSPQVSEPFSGQYSERTQCSKGHIQEKIGQFWTLTLPQDCSSAGPSGCSSVSKAFSKMFQGKSQEDCFCKECGGKGKAQKRQELTRAPQILVLEPLCEVELSQSLHTQAHRFSLTAVVERWSSSSEEHFTASVFRETDASWEKYDATLAVKVTPPSGRSSAAVLLFYSGQKCQKSAQNVLRSEFKLCKCVSGTPEDSSARFETSPETSPETEKKRDPQNQHFVDLKDLQVSEV